MKLSVILLILAFVLILLGLEEPVNGKYIILGCLLGLVGCLMINTDENKDDKGSSFRNNKTWKDDDVR